MLLPPTANAATISDPNSTDRVVGQFEFFRGTGQQGIDHVIDRLFNNVLSTVFLFLGAVAVISILYAAYRYVTSNGSPDALKKARGIIVNVFLGVVVITGAYAVVSAIVALGTYAGKLAF